MADKPSPWELGGLTARDLERRVVDEMSEDELLDRAAALSYYFLFALFPFLLFLVALIGFLPLGNLLDTLIGYAQQVLPADSASLLERTLGEIAGSERGGLLSIGALIALWSASAGMAAVMTSLNVAYDLEDHRPWWKRRLVAILLTLLFSAFLLLALASMVFGPKIGAAVAAVVGLGEVFTTVWNIASIPVAILLVLTGFALVYYLAPAAEQTWRWVTPGSAVAVVLWLIVSIGLRLYLTYFGDYSATYGSIGGVILLLLWLYLTGFVLLLGAEVNAEIEHAAAARGAVTAKPEGGAEPAGQRAAGGAPAASRGRAPAIRAAERSPRGAATGDEDHVVAGEAIARGIGALREQGRLPLMGLVTGVILGWVIKRPVGEIAGSSGAALRAGQQVAGAIAAWERFRRRRGPRRRAA